MVDEITKIIKNMIVKYKVEGFVEVDLNDDEIRQLNEKKSETMKKAYLREVLKYKLYNCSMTAEHEIDDVVNFDDLNIVSDWDKYAGNMLSKNEMYGSPLGIWIDNYPTTNKEIVENTIKEIGKRKGKNLKR